MGLEKILRGRTVDCYVRSLRRHDQINCYCEHNLFCRSCDYILYDTSFCGHDRFKFMQEFNFTCSVVFRL